MAEKGHDLERQIRERLENAGLNPDDPTVALAAQVASEVILDDYLNYLETNNTNLKAITDRVRDLHNKAVWAARLFALAGIAALIALLVSQFPEFIAALRQLFHSRPMNSLDLLVPSAIAAPESPGPLPDLRPLLPFAIYAMLGTAYAVCLITMMAATHPKKQANAFEIVKVLTSFFIGAATGKFT